MSTRIVDGVAELADAYDGFIIDLWGVIHDGAQLYPGAKSVLWALKAAGKATIFLSNAPRRATALVSLLTDLGVERELYSHVMSSGEAVHLEMRCRRDPWFARLGRRCLHLGAAADSGLFDGLDLDLAARVEEADFIMNTGLAGPDDSLAHHIPMMEAAAARGLAMVCANPDLVVIHQGHPRVCAGALALHYKALGGDVAYRGKPDPAIYDVCLQRLGIRDRKRVLAIGDGFPTDVAGAHAAGIDCLLIGRGIHAVELGAEGGVRPSAEAVAKVAQAQGMAPPSFATGAFLWQTEQ